MPFRLRTLLIAVAVGAVLGSLGVGQTGYFGATGSGDPRMYFLGAAMGGFAGLAIGLAWAVFLPTAGNRP
jgi:hypothetical protein